MRAAAGLVVAVIVALAGCGSSARCDRANPPRAHGPHLPTWRARQRKPVPARAPEGADGSRHPHGAGGDQPRRLGSDRRLPRPSCGRESVLPPRGGRDPAAARERDHRAANFSSASELSRDEGARAMRVRGPLKPHAQPVLRGFRRASADRPRGDAAQWLSGLPPDRPGGQQRPWGNLSNIAARLSPAAIASALADPPAPMPSYKSIEQSVRPGRLARARLLPQPAQDWLR